MQKTFEVSAKRINKSFELLKKTIYQECKDYKKQPSFNNHSNLCFLSSRLRKIIDTNESFKHFNIQVQVINDVLSITMFGRTFCIEFCKEGVK